MKTLVRPKNGRVDEIEQTEQDIDAQTVGEWVPVNEMFVDQTYARPIRKANIKRITDEWDVDAVGSLFLSLRSDGRYAILDGQHRWLVAKQKGVKRLPSRVYLDLDHAREARLFTWFNRVALPSALDRFRAALTEGRADALAIAAILHKHGLQVDVSATKQRNTVSAVAALEKVFSNFGAEILDEALGIIRFAWGTEERPYSSTAIFGVTAFLLRYEQSADRQRLIDRLTAVGQRAVFQRAAAVRSSGIGGMGEGGPFGRAIHAIYNHSLITRRLPEWETHLFTERGLQAVKRRGEAQRGLPKARKSKGNQ